MKRKTLSRFNGFHNDPKPLKRLNRVSGRNTGLKSGVNEQNEGLHEHASRIEV
jgi:hypothetical protein